MKSITHIKQRTIWEREHKQPYTLVQMDSDTPSHGVILFLSWLKDNGYYKKDMTGVEMACGKGRNCIWLTQQGINMTGFDYSKVAIEEAKARTKKTKAQNKASFLIQDATAFWPFKKESFDLAIDCYATTDIEAVKGRKFAVSEIFRVLKPKGFLLVYTLSTDDEFHKEMIKKSPAKEKNAFINPISSKFEKTFNREELLELYGSLKLVAGGRIKKIAKFFGKDYKCKHHWLVFQKVSVF